MNKIGWCDMTWNPVWGCRNNCEYCYARGIAKRFGSVMAEKEHRYTHKYLINSHIEWKVLENVFKNFKPTFLNSQFNKKFPKKSQRIFVGSMSEIYYWKEEWIEKVIEKVKQYPQHTFQFLTKHSEVYLRYDFPKNCWLGVTITKNSKYREENRWDVCQFKQDNPNNLKFYCFEPLLMEMELQYYHNLDGIDWVIIGAETGNRRGKVVPKKEWVLDIIRYCVLNKIPYYLKDSLSKYYGGYRGYKQFPKGGK